MNNNSNQDLYLFAQSLNAGRVNAACASREKKKKKKDCRGLRGSISLEVCMSCIIPKITSKKLICQWMQFGLCMCYQIVVVSHKDTNCVNGFQRSREANIARAHMRDDFCEWNLN